MLRKILRQMLDLLTEPIFRIYYHVKKVHPLDQVCFPIPHKKFPISCLGCFGCKINPSPPLKPKYEGPYKIFVTKTFCDQYAHLFGKGALVELLFLLEKHNEEVERKRGVKK